MKKYFHSFFLLVAFFASSVMADWHPSTVIGTYSYFTYYGTYPSNIYKCYFDYGTYTDRCTTPSASTLLTELNKYDNGGSLVTSCPVGTSPNSSRVCQVSCPTNSTLTNGSCVANTGYECTSTSCTALTACPAGYTGYSPNCTLSDQTQVPLCEADQYYDPSTGCQSESCPETGCTVNGCNNPANDWCPAINACLDKTLPCISQAIASDDTAPSSGGGDTGGTGGTTGGDTGGTGGTTGGDTGGTGGTTGGDTGGTGGTTGGDTGGTGGTTGGSTGGTGTIDTSNLAKDATLQGISDYLRQNPGITSKTYISSGSSPTDNNAQAIAEKKQQIATMWQTEKTAFFNSITIPTYSSALACDGGVHIAITNTTFRFCFAEYQQQIQTIGNAIVTTATVLSVLLILL